MGRLIGIDLGTTNSVAAIVDGPQPRVLENREARTQTRSAVGVRTRRGKGGVADAQLLVGDAAIDNWPLAPKDTIISVKRLMGRAVDDPEVERIKATSLYSIIQPTRGTKDSVRVVMDGREYSPIEISALILKKIKEDAEFRLGDSVTHAVITVPAYFTQIQRDATRKAGLMADLKVIKILDEPTAAAVAFGVQSPDDTPRTVLVYDLGGGTFDISVLMCAANVFAPLNLEGDMWLGGDNFDQVLVDYALEHVRSEYGVDPRGNLRFMAELKRAAQTVKERLSAAETADLIVTGLLQDADANLIDVDLPVTRREFERLILPLVGPYIQCSIGHTNFVTDAVCAVCGGPIAPSTMRNGRALELTKKALQHQSVGMRPDQIDYVVMAGNSTNIPLVQRTMEDLFGAERVVRKTHPKHAVAMGAAIVAAWMGQRLVCQAPEPGDSTRECGHVNEDEAMKCARCGASLVIEAEPTGGGAALQPGGVVGGIASTNYGMGSAGDAFTVFIRKGDPFPTQEPQSHVFRTGVPRQRMVSIPIYGGEFVQRASANERQGEAFAVLPADLPQGTALRIKLWLDRDGVFKVSAFLENGEDLKPWLVKGEEDARAIAAVIDVDKALGEGDPLESMVAARIDAARNRIFERLRGGRYDEALREAEDAVAQVVGARAAPAESPEQNARLLLQWSEFVLSRYDWAFERPMQYRLRGLIDQLSAALAAHDDRRMAVAYRELDEATLKVPPIVSTMLQMRSAVNNRVRPADPGAFATFQQEFDRLEQLFRTQAPEAATTLATIMANINHTLERIAQTTGLSCSRGHSVPKGERFCPECREDSWSLIAGEARR